MEKDRDMLLTIDENGNVRPLLGYGDAIKELKFMQEQNKAIIGLLEEISDNVHAIQRHTESHTCKT